MCVYIGMEKLFTDCVNCFANSVHEMLKKIIYIYIYTYIYIYIYISLAYYFLPTQTSYRCYHRPVFKPNVTRFIYSVMRWPDI